MSCSFSKNLNVSFAKFTLKLSLSGVQILSEPKNPAFLPRNILDNVCGSIRDFFLLSSLTIILNMTIQGHGRDEISLEMRTVKQLCLSFKLY